MPETLEELNNADPAEMAKFSWYNSKDYGLTTMSKNQNKNNCWAYATISAAETSILKKVEHLLLKILINK